MEVYKYNLRLYNKDRSEDTLKSERTETSKQIKYLLNYFPRVTESTTRTVPREPLQIRAENWEGNKGRPYIPIVGENALNYTLE